jgi:hypothetical protein
MGCLQQEEIGNMFNNIFYEGNLIGLEVNKPFSADVCYDMETVKRQITERYEEGRFTLTDK